MEFCSESLYDHDFAHGVHLSGIGGVGMTALAEMLLDLNINVTGSDTTYSANVKRLEARGIKIYGKHDKKHVSKRLVCRSRVIKDDNEEIKYARKSVYRSTLLSFLAKEKKQLVITGSHGKTTTSALLAHTMEECGLRVSYAVGGLCPNLNRYGKICEGEYFVIEGDESDGSHLKTDPFGGILTSADIDHLAFWKNGENLISSYKTFASKMKSTKNFLYNGEDKILQKLHLKGLTFGSKQGYDFYPKNTALNYLKSSFVIDEKRINFPMFGEYNIQNAVAVYGLLRSFNICEKKIIKAFSTFAGISRRMEYLGKNIYSDYAHHPQEVKCVLKTIKKISPDIKIIFEPHRLSRFKDELNNFCELFHNVIITDIFEANEGLNIASKPLLHEFCKRTNSKYISLHEIEDFLKNENKKVLALGAGPLDQKLRNYVNN